MSPAGAPRMTTALAVLLLAVSLGLPWGVRHEQVAVVGSPFTIQLWNGVGGGYCCLRTLPTYDTSRTLSTQVVVGAQHPARFGIVAALALLLLGGRRRHLWAGLLVAAELLLSGSAGFTAGGVAAAWMGALALGVAAARREAARA